MFAFKREHIGGGVARRVFKFGEEFVRAGTHLSAEVLHSIPIANLRALVENRFIEVYPKVDRTDEGGHRFLVHRGGAKYDVYFGVKVNDEPLSKHDAQELVKQAI